MDLVEFLTARLDEDEQTARGAGGRWMVLPVTGWIQTAPVPMSEWKPPGSDHHVASVPLDRDREHIVRHDPARVLAEVAAKRALLRVHGPSHDCVADRDAVEYASEQEPCLVLRYLALPYAGHPDYDEAWRP